MIVVLPGYDEEIETRKRVSRMECNIDDRGARVRRVWGMASLLAGVLVAGLAWWLGIWWLWIVAGACVAGGAFALFEAKKKWCVVRAMGMKTPV